MSLSEVIRQLPALIGVAVGALGSYLIATATERARWRRDRQAQWDERRVAAYAEYATAVKRIYQITLHIAAHHALFSFPPPLPPAEGLPQLVAAGNDRGAKWETVLLVGTPGAVEAAREWHQTIWVLEELACQGNCDKAEWAKAIERSGHARSRFYQVARKDLGMVDAQLPDVGSSLVSRLADQMHDADRQDVDLGVEVAPQAVT